MRGKALAQLCQNVRVPGAAGFCTQLCGLVGSSNVSGQPSAGLQVQQATAADCAGWALVEDAVASGRLHLVSWCKPFASARLCPCACRAENAVTAEWSPCGRYLMSATVAPRLRVDNGFQASPAVRMRLGSCAEAGPVLIEFRRLHAGKASGGLITLEGSLL